MATILAEDTAIAERTVSVFERGRGVLPLMVLAHFSHHLATGVLVPLLPLVRDDFGLDYSRAGLLVSAFSVVYGVSQLPMGTLADYIDRRWLIAVGLVGAAIGIIATGFAGDYWLMFGLLVVVGVFGGSYHPVASPLVSEYFSAERRGGALGMHVLGGSLGVSATPVFAGLVTGLWGWRTAFWLLPLPALTLAALMLLLLKPPPSAMVGRRKARAATSVSWLEVARLIGVLVAIAMVGQLMNGGIHAFLPLYLVDKHGIAPTVAAMLVGVSMGAGVIGAPLGGRLSDFVGRRPIILTSVVGVGPFLWLLTVAPFGAGLIIAMVFLGLFQSSRMPAIESLIMDVIPEQRRATVLGVYFFVNMEIGGLAAVILGFLFDWFGLDQVFSAMAMVAVASSVLVFFIRGRV